MSRKEYIQCDQATECEGFQRKASIFLAGVNPENYNFFLSSFKSNSLGQNDMSVSRMSFRVDTCLHKWAQTSGQSQTYACRLCAYQISWAEITTGRGVKLP